MPITTEDGTMPDGSNSYATATEADDYLSMRIDGWPVATEVPDPELAKKERALVRATDWLNTLKWKSAPVVDGRVMAWPRADYYQEFDVMPLADDFTGGESTKVKHYIVPDAVKRACMEMAAIIYTGADPLAPVERGGRVQSKTESSVGPIGAESTTWFADAPSETLYTAVVGLVAPYLAVVPGKRGVVGSVKTMRG